MAKQKIMQLDFFPELTKLTTPYWTGNRPKILQLELDPDCCGRGFGLGVGACLLKISLTRNYLVQPSATCPLITDVKSNQDHGSYSRVLGSHCTLNPVT